MHDGLLFENGGVDIVRAEGKLLISKTHGLVGAQRSSPCHCYLQDESGRETSMIAPPTRRRHVAIESFPTLFSSRDVAKAVLSAYGCLANVSSESFQQVAQLCLAAAW